MQNSKIDLNELAHLAKLFNLFHSGRHLNRLTDAALWFELEQKSEQYKYLFLNLGFDLRIDNRGFAWFHNEETSSNMNKQSRQLALLIMVIFDHQADAGRSLGQFDEWTINNDLLEQIYKKRKDVMDAEELDQGALTKIFESAARKGFVKHENNNWHLLPSIHRYLDHFKAISEKASKSDVINYEEEAAC